MYWKINSINKNYRKSGNIFSYSSFFVAKVRLINIRRICCPDTVFLLFLFKKSILFLQDNDVYTSLQFFFLFHLIILFASHGRCFFFICKEKKNEKRTLFQMLDNESTPIEIIKLNLFLLGSKMAF